MEFECIQESGKLLTHVEQYLIFVEGKELTSKPQNLDQEHWQ